jgi:hypothetical protein
MNANDAFERPSGCKIRQSMTILVRYAVLHGFMDLDLLHSVISCRNRRSPENITIAVFWIHA